MTHDPFTRTPLARGTLAALGWAAVGAAPGAGAQAPAPAPTAGQTVVHGTALGADGRPMPRAFVRLSTAAGPDRGRTLLATARLDADGRFAVVTGASGPLTLEVRSVGYRRADVPLLLGAPQAVALDVRLRRTSPRARVDSVRLIGDFNKLSLIHI